VTYNSEVMNFGITQFLIMTLNVGLFVKISSIYYCYYAVLFDEHNSSVNSLYYSYSSLNCTLFVSWLRTLFKKPTVSGPIITMTGFVNSISYRAFATFDLFAIYFSN